MTVDEARERLQSAIDQFGAHATPMIEGLIGQIRSEHGRETANDLIDEFDLELQYNIAPTGSLDSAD